MTSQDYLQKKIDQNPIENTFCSLRYPSFPVDGTSTKIKMPFLFFSQQNNP